MTLQDDLTKRSEQRNALVGMIGAPAAAREQTVWTPPWFLDCVDQVFPEGWSDPYPAEGAPATERGNLRIGWGMALENDWSWTNFANPPYDELKLHLPRMREQWNKHWFQTVALVPIRTRREWWCRAVGGASIAYLKPLAFVGHTNTHPENLAAIYWGDRKALFRLAFAPHSHHIQDQF